MRCGFYKRGYGLVGMLAVDWDFDPLVCLPYGWWFLTLFTIYCAIAFVGISDCELVLSYVNLYFACLPSH